MISSAQIQPCEPISSGTPEQQLDHDGEQDDRDASVADDALELLEQPERRRGIPCPEAPAAWELARKMIEHEDALVDHRMTHYLTTQGFLFAAMALLAKEGIGNPDKQIFLWLAMLASFIALLTGRVASHSIDAAHEQLTFVSEWWYKTHKDVPGGVGEANKATAKNWTGSYPRITGHITSGSAIRDLVKILSVSWTVVILLLAYQTIRS